MPKGIYDHSKRDYKKVWETRRKNDPNNNWYKKCLKTKIDNGTNKRSKKSNRQMIETRRKNGTLTPSFNQCQKLWETRRKNGTDKINHTEKTKRKLRVYKVNEIKKTGHWQTIGKNETKLLNKQEKIDNCKITRQYIIENLGYIVDGYDKENNIVYEVYEKAHKNQIEHDLRRQKEIEDHLKCKFIIIKDGWE